METTMDETAFRLAYAIAHDRDIALAILKEAPARAQQLRELQIHAQRALASWRRKHPDSTPFGPYSWDMQGHEATRLQLAICEEATTWEQCQEHGGLVWRGEIKAPPQLAAKLQTPQDPLARYLQTHIANKRLLVEGLNAALRDTSFYQPNRFAEVRLPPALQAAAHQRLQGTALIRRNRQLLEAAYPNDIVPSREPTLADRLVRYGKHLVVHAMRQNARFVAVGVGSLLYRYTPYELAHFFPDIVTPSGRPKKALTKALKARFPNLPLEHTQPPTAAERALVLRFLSKLAPWSPSCASLPSSPYDLFLSNDRARDGHRIHALLCECVGSPICACIGFPRFVTEYKAHVPETAKMHGNSSDDRLRLPQFPASGGGDVEDRFAPAPLTPEERAALEAAWQRQHQRREQYRPGLLSVYVDGQNLAEFDPQSDKPRRLQVPAGASNVEIYGHDAEGPFLVAVFPVAGVGGYEVGQTVPFLLSAVHRADGTLSEELVTLTYQESPLAAARVWGEHVAQRVATVLKPSDDPGWRELAVRYACMAVLGVSIGGTGVGYYYRQQNQRLHAQLAQAQMQVAQAQLFQDIAASKLLPDVPAQKRSETRHYVQELVMRLQQGLHGATFKTATAVATVFLYAEDFESALEWFAKAQTLDPDEPEPYLAMAAISKIKGDHRQSIYYLEQLFARQKQAGIRDPRTPNYLGWAYYALGQEPEASTYYDQALAWSPEYADALFNRALVYQRQRNDAQYQTLLEQARRLLQQDITAHPKHARAYFGLAKLSAHEANWTQALQHLRTAIALDPEWAFWVQYEPFFPVLTTTVPDAAGTIRDVADVYVADKIAQTRALLPRTG